MNDWAQDEVVGLPLRSWESEILSGLVRQLRQLVSAPTESDDPLENWAAELEAAPIDHSDPVVARLFPRGFTRPDLDAEYRRLTEMELRTLKDRDAQIVLDDLAEAAGRRAHAVIAHDRAIAWLRTLNALRLALATRLGIETGADADALEAVRPSDPRYDAIQVYHWLGYLQEGILTDLGSAN